MKRISLFVLVAMLLLASFGVGPAGAAAGADITVSAVIDPASKQVSVDGTISSGSDQAVTIKIVYPSGNLYVNQVTSGENGSFHLGYKLSQAAEGEYTVYASGRDVSEPAATTFTYTAPPVSDTVPPAAPTGLVVSGIKSNSLTLTWNAASLSDDVTAYVVKRGTIVLSDNVTSTHYNVTGLAKNTKYTFTVIAKDAAGNSSQPATVTAKTSNPSGGGNSGGNGSGNSGDGNNDNNGNGKDNGNGKEDSGDGNGKVGDKDNSKGTASGGTKCSGNDKGCAINRGDFVSLILSSLNLLDPNADMNFTDVPSDDSHYRDIASAYELGITKGYADGSFGAGNSIHREDLFVMAVRALKAAGITLEAKRKPIEFKDAKQMAPYAKEAVQMLYQAGIINGSGNGYLNPKGEASWQDAEHIVGLIASLKK